jgi:LytS/YehU family sensor histidine kinase
MLVENHQLRAENFRNQYEALKNWINPHMLFNSLNTLQSLIRDTPPKAREYTRELSNVLRYTLQCNEAQTATLRDELEFTRAYIYLLKMRYEDNLVFGINVDARFSDYLLPPTTLQHLVENAVKHNEISTRHPFTIHIYTSGDGVLSVSNLIQPKLTRATGTGTGLNNLSKRYQLLFHREIEISNHSDIFCVNIPLINPLEYESADC